MKLIYLDFFIPQNLGKRDFGIFPNLMEIYGAVKPAPQNPKTSGISSHLMWLWATSRDVTETKAVGRSGQSE